MALSALPLVLALVMLAVDLTKERAAAKVVPTPVTVPHTEEVRQLRTRMAVPKALSAMRRRGGIWRSLRASLPSAELSLVAALRRGGAESSGAAGPGADAGATSRLPPVPPGDALQ